MTGRRNRQCGRSSLSSDFDDVCHCEGKCAERGTSSRNGCRHSCQHRLCCGIRTVRLEDSRNALVVSCGDVQLGDRGRSKETLRALACRRFSSSLPEGALFNCTSCCPSRDATMVVLTKKKRKKKEKNAKRRLPLHEKDLLRVGANVGSKIFSQVRSLAADRVSPPVSKRQNNHLAPSCRLSLKKLLNSTASTSLATIGARSSFSGARLAHEFPRSFLVAAIIFPHTKWLKKKSLIIVTLPL